MIRLGSILRSGGVGSGSTYYVCAEEYVHNLTRRMVWCLGRWASASTPSEGTEAMPNMSSFAGSAFPRIAAAARSSSRLTR